MPVWWWFSWVNYMCVNSLSRVYRAYFNFSLCALILVADDEIPRQLLISRWYVLVLGMTQVLIWNFVVSIHCNLRWFPIRPFWLYLKSRVAKKYGSIQWRALSKHLCPEPPHHQCNLMFIPFANGLWISFDSGSTWWYQEARKFKKYCLPAYTAVHQLSRYLSQWLIVYFHLSSHLLFVCQGIISGNRLQFIAFQFVRFVWLMPIWNKHRYRRCKLQPYQNSESVQMFDSNSGWFLLCERCEHLVHLWHLRGPRYLGQHVNIQQILLNAVMIKAPGHTNEEEESPNVSFADPYLEQCAVWGLDLAGYFDAWQEKMKGEKMVSYPAARCLKWSLDNSL